jgi:hypothetical protein
MTSIEPQPSTPPPSPPIQFSLRMLLLLCVVLGSSLAVFGAWDWSPKETANEPQLG